MWGRFWAVPQFFTCKLPARLYNVYSIIVVTIRGIMAAPEIKKILKISSDIKEVKVVSAEITGSLKDRGLSDDAIFDIRLSIEEALCNAIKHGNKNNTSLPVEVSYSVDNDKLEIVIEDKGEGFELKNVPGPTSDENILKTSGRGVYLIQQFMDKVEYNEMGNRVHMIKYLNSQHDRGER